MNNQELIRKIKDLGSYLDSRIEEQLKRPYSEREDIERNLALYREIKSKYDVAFREELSRSLESEVLEQNNPIGPDSPIGDVYREEVGDMRVKKAIGQLVYKNKISTLKEFAEKIKPSEILSLRNVGAGTYKKIKDYFESKGLSLREENGE